MLVASFVTHFVWALFCLVINFVWLCIFYSVKLGVHFPSLVMLGVNLVHVCVGYHNIATLIAIELSTGCTIASYAQLSIKGTLFVEVHDFKVSSSSS